MGGHFVSQIINIFYFLENYSMKFILLQLLAIHYVTFATSLYCGLIRHGHAKQTCHYIHT